MADQPGWLQDSRQQQQQPYTPTASLFNNVITAAVGLSTQNIPTSHGGMTLNQAHEEGSRLVRNNLNSVINELGPLMEQARAAESHGLNLRSWLRRPRVPDRQPVQSHPLASDSTIIDFDIGEPSTSQQQARDQHMFPSSPTEAPVHSQPPAQHIPIPPHNIEVGGAASVNTADRSSETHSLVTFLQKYVPFVVILLGKAIYDHRAGILIFLGLLVTFTHADSVVKREVAKQSRRSIFSVAILSLNISVCICFIYYVFEDQHLYKSLVFIAPYEQPLSLWDLLWIVGITDFVLKFITILLKLSMTAFPGWLLPFPSRGKYYLLLECLSQLYRGLAPIQPWLYYLLESYQGPEKVIGVFLSAAYMVSKGTDLMGKVKMCKRAVWKMLQNVSLGVSPNKEQLDTAGAQCPICHDEYDTPVLLHCRHVFCEACVTTWFDREQTCPLCRAKVADDPSWRDGATTFFAQLF